MDREETREAAKVMQHFADGGEVEAMARGGTRWNDHSEPAWAWASCDYRIKPQPRYEPLDAEGMRALPGEVLEHKEHKVCFLVTAYSPNTNQVLIDDRWTKPGRLKDVYIRIDGTPVGRKVTE